MGKPSEDILAQEAIEDLQSKAAGRYHNQPYTATALEEQYEAGQDLALKNADLPQDATDSARQGYQAAFDKGGKDQAQATPKEAVAEQQLETGAIKPGHVRPYASNPARQVIASSNPDRGPLPQDVAKVELTSNADPRITKPVAQMSTEEKQATAGAVPDAGHVVGSHAEPGTAEFKHYVRPSNPDHHGIAAQHGLAGASGGTMNPGHGITHLQPPEDEEGHHRTPGSAVPVTGADKIDPEHGKSVDPRLAAYPGAQSVIATAHNDPHTATGQRMKPVDVAPEDATPGSDKAQQAANPETDKPHQFSPTGEQKADDYHH